MKLAYKRTYAIFADTYLTAYYASGLNTFRNMAGGPFYIFIGALIIIFNRDTQAAWLRWPLLIFGAGLALYGLYYLLRPFINLGLVWLRRDTFLGEEGQTITVELHQDFIAHTLPEGSFEIPYDNILLLQRRTDATWIITNTDQVIQIPRENLLEGDHDTFIDKLDLLLNPPEDD